MCPLICFTEKVMCSTGSWLQCTYWWYCGVSKTSSSSHPGTHHSFGSQASQVVGREAFHLTMKQQFCKQVKMQSFPSFNM